MKQQGNDYQYGKSEDAWKKKSVPLLLFQP
jgi:hypothetical protein